jgi:hypothetical protein
MIEFQGLREGLRWQSPRDEIILVLKRIAEWSARAGVTVRITSFNDHEHQKFVAPSDADTGQRESLHYQDLALDFQILKKDGAVSKNYMDRLVRFLKKELPGNCYDIIWRKPGHNNHCHVEYDSRQR